MVGRIEQAPPPSTYAAQIVDNIENARSRPHSSGSRSHLQELLHRVLEADKRDTFAEGAFDSSLEVNHKLICVIVRACLSFPASLNPFESQRDVFEQARDSLAVIRVTIKRVPEVLWELPDGEDTYARPEGPLFLWLIPHLLNLLYHEVGVEVRSGAQRVLKTILNVKKRSSLRQSGPLQIPRFVQGCIEGRLEGLSPLTDMNDKA